ncbi:hypothetical protein BGP_6686 [Beggiatoa sp. PS]|nr:hypothetical protein BGP_6686 [Beggiatoa sp. PS]
MVVYTIVIEINFKCSKRSQVNSTHLKMEIKWFDMVQQAHQPLATT